jgi:hypothetical protein
MRGLLDPGVEVIPFLEIHIDDMVAANDAIQRNRVALYVYPPDRRDLARQRHEGRKIS